MHRKLICGGRTGLIHKKSVLLESLDPLDVKQILEENGFQEFISSSEVPKNALFDIYRLPLINVMQHAGLENIECEQYHALKIHDDIVDLTWFRIDECMELMVRIFERIEGRTSESVKEIIPELLFPIIAGYGHLGYNHPSVKTAIFDLARLRGEDPVEYFEGYTEELEKMELEEDLN